MSDDPIEDGSWITKTKWYLLNDSGSMIVWNHALWYGCVANRAWFPQQLAWMVERDDIERRLMRGEAVRVRVNFEDWKMVTQSND